MREAAAAARDASQAQFMPPSACMLLSPKYLPRLAAIVGLFTRYGLRDVAR